MPTPKEVVLELDISGPGGEAEKAGWEVRKMQYIGRRACPDRWHFRAGVLVIIEYKRVGEEPDGLQKKEHRRLKEAGFVVHVIDTHDDARRVLKLGPYA